MQEDLTPESWVREVGGALVQFGDGAVVTKVSLGSDFSAVRLTRLSRRSSPSSVVSLVARLGFCVSEDCIRINLPQGNDIYCSADVRVEDPHFAKRLCGLQFFKQNPDLAIPITAPMPQAKNNRRVDSRKVHCSWHKPTKTAWLNFSDGDIAASIGRKFEDGIYKVLGQTVKCDGPSRGKSYNNRLPWTLRLSNIPELATKEDITDRSCTFRLPGHVEMGPPTYTINIRTANMIIESLLLEVGRLEWWEGCKESMGKRFKAKARFTNDEDARRAVKLLDNLPLPFHKSGKLTVQLVHSARLRVPARVYDAVTEGIADHKREWDSRHLSFVAYPPVQRFRVLKIEGQVSKDLADAMTTLEKIFAGEVAMSDGEALWEASFATNGHAYQQMKQIERDHGIVIVRDKRRCELRLLGPRTRCWEAQRALVELAKDDLSSIFAIELSPQKLSWALKGGFRTITAAISDGKVTLDIVSSPRRILVVGSEDDFRLAQGIVEGREWLMPKPEAGSTSDCDICWTEAEIPVITLCKHVYCADCFEDLCFAGVSATDPGISCQGDEGRCGALISLDELREHVSSSSLEDIFEAAFEFHVARHPNELRYCPTPDCGQIYRAAKELSNSDSPPKTTIDSDPILSTCPNCLALVCTACHAVHDGLTCAEYREHVSGEHEALQAAKEELGIKDCPGCGTLIEKELGCNHVSCPACSAHICWVCLRSFAAGSQVYTHMNEEHGGIGLDEELAFEV